MFKIILSIFLVVIILLILGGMGFFYLFLKGPDLSKYEHLKEPRIIAKKDQKVLEVPFEVPADGLKTVICGFI